MKPSKDSLLSVEPAFFTLKDLTVRALREEEYPRASELLQREHYLGDCPGGRQLLQVVENPHGQWLALLDWGPACWKLADRESHIGWTAQQRAERLGLIVQNRRFLILGKRRMPNLASRALRLAIKALPQHWEQAHGYRPLMAETFTDIELFEGTCYNAADWKPVGLTRGFQRHRADFFTKHGRPKKLWMKSFNRNALRILTGMDVPKAYQPALNPDTPERDLALNKKQMQDLRTHFQQHFKDPRRNNRSFPASSLLVMITMALFSGRHTLAAIQRYGNLLTQSQRSWLDFPLRDKDSPVRKAPSFRALQNFLTKIDPKEFADCLNKWLGSHLGTLPRALAIDGKWIRDCALSLCLSDHETGAPVAIGFAAEVSKTDENKREGEQTVALELYEKTDLEGAIITGDALNNNKAQAHAILKAGGDYFVQLKDENRHAYQAAQRLAREGSPLLSTPKNPTSPTGASTSVA
jgi:ribosomal protein S15P/S13E